MPPAPPAIINFSLLNRQCSASASLAFISSTQSNTTSCLPDCLSCDCKARLGINNFTLSLLKKSSTKCNLIWGLISLIRAAMTSILLLPKLLSVAGNCRLTLEATSTSMSINVISPTPVRASPSAAHEPTPPTPTTYACRFSNLLNCAAPYSFWVPAKRRSYWASVNVISGVISAVIVMVYLNLGQVLYSICLG